MFVYVNQVPFSGGQWKEEIIGRSLILLPVYGSHFERDTLCIASFQIILL